jgi:hypothetical protein
MPWECVTLAKRLIDLVQLVTAARWRSQTKKEQKPRQTICEESWVESFLHPHSPEVSKVPTKPTLIRDLCQEFETSIAANRMLGNYANGVGTLGLPFSYSVDNPKASQIGSIRVCAYFGIGLRDV